MSDNEVESWVLESTECSSFISLSIWKKNDSQSFTLLVNTVHCSAHTFPSPSCHSPFYHVTELSHNGLAPKFRRSRVNESTLPGTHVLWSGTVVMGKGRYKDKKDKDRNLRFSERSLTVNLKNES